MINIFTLILLILICTVLDASAKSYTGNVIGVSDGDTITALNNN